MSISPRLSLLVLVIAVAGCATYVPRPLDPDRTAQTFAARRLDDPDLHVYLRKQLGRDPQRWDFPTLALTATYYQSDIALARAQWRTAEADAIAAGSRANPNLTATNQYNTSARSISPWTVGFDINFMIETAGKRGDRIAAAEQRALAQQLRLTARIWQVHRRLRARLLDIYRAERTLATLATQTTAQSRYLDFLARARSAGNLSAFMQTQTRLALDATRLQTRVAEQQAAVARAQTAQVIGVPAAALAATPLSLSMFDRPALPSAAIAPELRRMALRQRPDIAAALADYAAAEAALKLEVARQYPDLTLGPGYSWDQGAHKWGLALGFVLPLFNRNGGPIEVAAAKRAEAAARFIALQDRVSGDIDTALVSYNAALARLTTADEALAQNAAAARESAQRLRDAPVTRGARLSADIALATATLARLDALFEAQRALGQLEDAVGAPLDPLEIAPSAAETGARGAS